MNFLFRRLRTSRVGIHRAWVDPVLIAKVLKAYRPLYQCGRILDGPYRWPSAGDSGDPIPPAPRQRVLLVALVWSRAFFLSHPDKS